MHYRRLGRTGMMVSEIGFCGWPIGGQRWGSVEDEDSLAALQRAFDLGINFYDTADVYGHGHSEELIGQAFASKRPSVIIATKAGVDFYAGEPSKHTKHNFSPGYIRTAVARSLERLRTDYVDILQLHNPPQRLSKDDGVWEALAGLKREGKVRFYGVSARTANDALAYLKSADSGDEHSHRFGDTLQVAFNLLDQEAAAKGAFVEAYRQDWGIIARVPLASGMLTGKYAGDHYFPRDDFRSIWSPARLKDMSRRVEALRFLVKAPVSMTQAALAFVLSQEAVSTVITGAKTEAQVEENTGAPALAPLSQDDLRRVQALWDSGFGDPVP